MRTQLAILLILMLLPRVTSAQQARREAWRQDLDVVINQFLAQDSSFTAEARKAFAGRVAQLRDSIPLLTDEQLTTRLATAVAASGNAHTRLYLVRNRSDVRRYPIRIWRFEDGWYVNRAREEYKSLLGARITHLNGRRIEELERLVAPLYAGKSGWKRYLASYTLTSPEILKGVGVELGVNDSLVVCCVRNGMSGTQVNVAPMPLTRGNFVTESWWDLSPLHPGRSGPWRSALQDKALPLYLQQPERHYWFTRDTSSNLLFVQYNRSQDEPGRETVRDFGIALMKEIARAEPAKLVVDLRFNTGGNLDLADPLFRGLAALPLAQQHGRMFVITSGTTFSAGMSHAGVLRQHTRALFVGEDVGDVLDYWSEGGNILLPNSKLTIHFTNGFHAYSKQKYPGRREHYAVDIDTLEPNLATTLRWADYMSGRDPALAAVLAYP